MNILRLCDPLNTVFTSFKEGRIKNTILANFPVFASL